MDSDDELELAGALLTDQAASNAVVDKHLAIITCMVGLLAQINVAPQIGGSKPDRRMNKDRRRMQGHMTLWQDYFADEPTHGDREFRRRFRMNKDLFMVVLMGVRRVAAAKAARGDQDREGGEVEDEEERRQRRDIGVGVEEEERGGGGCA